MISQPSAEPIGILTAEHQVAAARLDQFQAALTRAVDGDDQAWPAALATLRAIVPFLDRDVEIHIRKEEEALFPRLGAALPDDDRLLVEQAAEHDQVRLRRDRLRATLVRLGEGTDRAVGEEQWASERTRLRRAGLGLLRTLRMHFRNEEEVVFPLASRLLSADQLTAAGEQMAAIERAWTEGVQRPVVSATRAWPHAALRSFDLEAEFTRLKETPVWRRGQHTTGMLVKQPHLRVMLLAMPRGARLADHTTAGPLTLQVPSGRVRAQVAGSTIEVAAGTVLVLEEAVAHAVEALEDSAVLLTIAWPGDGPGQPA